jgi:hypothetical protein
MKLELEGWKIKVALVAVLLLVVMAPLGCAVKSNQARAEDWHRRAVLAEESVGGLRTVIVERSRALNERTLQANLLASRLDSNRDALRQSKADAGTLARRQQDLAGKNAQVEKEARTLRSQQAALVTLTTKLSACTKRLAGAVGAATGKRARTVSADTRALRATCTRASENLDAYLEGLR